MDKNTFTGLFLIMIVLGAWFYFIKPSDAEIKKEKERIAADSLKKQMGSLQPQLLLQLHRHQL